MRELFGAPGITSESKTEPLLLDDPSISDRHLALPALGYPQIRGFPSRDRDVYCAVQDYGMGAHMFVDAAALRTALLEKEPRDFVSHYLFEPVPYLFEGNLTAWIQWKTKLAASLEVDPYDIVLTGTAALGFSLNPKKAYKAFDGHSDIDCGVISQYHFEAAWRYLRQMRPAWLSLPPDSKRAITAHRTNYVFAGTIATDIILGLLPFGAAWQKALDFMGEMAPTVGRDVRLRIYRDYDALRHYQASGIERLRNDLSAQPVSSELEITTED